MSSTETVPCSCDSFVATGRGSTTPLVFGKNSDRPARESQVLQRLPARRRGRRLRLAYVEIDDAEQTLLHIGSSPYWCWGHEMGMNIAGVVIGNEALFTRELADNMAEARQGREPKPGLLGMEPVPLGLERAATAREAVTVITDLLESHGQWGAGTVSADRVAAAYDNSFLIADHREAWALETFGRRWAARKILEESWSLSNEPTIRTDWTSSSSDLLEYLRHRGWAAATGEVDFAEAVTDPCVPLQASHLRLQRSRQLLVETLKTNGRVDFEDARHVLSDHYETSFLEGPKFGAARPDFHTLCMHEHPSGFTWGNTAASMIAVLPREGAPYFWWAATTPCTSVYLPISPLGTRLPPSLGTAGAGQGSGPTPDTASLDSSDSASFWWLFQGLLETVAGDQLGHAYTERQPIVRSRFDDLQTAWSAEAAALKGGRRRRPPVGRAHGALHRASLAGRWRTPGALPHPLIPIRSYRRATIVPGYFLGPDATSGGASVLRSISTTSSACCSPRGARLWATGSTLRS